MTITTKPFSEVKLTDTLVVFASEQTNLLNLNIVDKEFAAVVSQVIKDDGFDGSFGKTVVVHGASPKRVIVVGMGKVADLTVYDVQSLGAVAARKAKELHASDVAIVVSPELMTHYSMAKVAEALTMGAILGTYTFTKHKAPDKKAHVLSSLTLTAKEEVEELKQGALYGEVVARAVAFTRDLVNEPSSVTTPTYMAEVAQSLAKKNPAITVEVLDRAAMKKLGMGGLLGIAQGTDEEPKFIRLNYKGGGKKTIALVGKGITFDTGGLSLKTSDGMETMKLDMAGAAAILGAFSVLSEVKPSAHVVGLLSVTENMPSGKAVKPGDVVRAMNGKTIEILNTDAEGRVVLSDALSYAVEKVKPDEMVDLATLTGACMVALGEEIAGIFCNTPAFAEKLKTIATDTGEKLWELPLAKEYKNLLKSTVADIKNISGKRYGGATTGALFLQEFVPDSIPWAHLDIAGPAFAESEKPLTPRGGTGFGVALLLEYLKNS